MQLNLGGGKLCLPLTKKVGWVITSDQQGASAPSPQSQTRDKSGINVRFCLTKQKYERKKDTNTGCQI